MILLEEGAANKEFRDQDFFCCFWNVYGKFRWFCFFLSGEKVLEKDLMQYSDLIAENIYRALKYEE